MCICEPRTHAVSSKSVYLHTKNRVAIFAITHRFRTVGVCILSKKVVIILSDLDCMTSFNESQAEVKVFFNFFKFYFDDLCVHIS